MLPLEGITVISLEQAVAAPLATRHLADLGARVIKVERPGQGDFARHYDDTVHGESSYFVWLNRGKESIELDIKDDEDQSLLRRMIASADVLVQNLLPGAVERLGLDATTLRSEHPELIHCSISGYGPDGPYRSKKAYDLLVQCEAGLVSTTGSQDQVAKVGISIADIATGMYAYSGVLTSLLLRDKTQQGATLEVSMLDALGEWMMQPTYYSRYGGNPTQRTGARHASIAPYGPYLAGDGASVFLSVQNDREWATLCDRILHLPELAVDPRFAHNPERVMNDAHITDLLHASFADHSADELVAMLDDAGIACARLRTPRELMDHPQLKARNRWRQVRLPNGPSIEAILPPANIAGVEAVMGEVPALGGHNATLRHEFRNVASRGE